MNGAQGSGVGAQTPRPFNFEQLDVWRISLNFTEKIYRSSQNFPKEEIYGLTAQLRRAAVSIPSNIAEGKGRYSKKDFRNFLFTARGSLYEVVTQIRLACSLGYLDPAKLYELNEDAHEILRKLSGLIKSLDSSLMSEPGAPSPEL